MRLNVMYSTDENYAQHAIASIISLLEKNKKFDDIYIYIVENEIYEETKKYIEKIVEEFGRKVIFINIKDICKNLKTKDDFPVSAYARLFISNIDNIDNIEKILYLDCDTIVNESLEDLWNINIDNYLVAGVQDNPAMYMSTIIGMTEDDRYLNSGVLLINLKKWKQENIEKHFMTFIDMYKGCVPHHDQGVINGVCKNKILVISPKYNVMPEMIYLGKDKIMKLYNINNYYEDKEIVEAKEKPVIIHYISKFYNRPWNKSCTHPYKELYTFYLDKYNYDYKITNQELDKGTLIRKCIFYKCNFELYQNIEKLLNIKRKRFINKKYSKLDIKI